MREAARNNGVVKRFLAAGLAAALCTAQDGSLERRRQTRDELLRLLAPSNAKASARISAADGASWERWLKRTGELPPDFARLPSYPMLPDPLEGVRTRAGWQARRAWIRGQYEQWVTGRMPPAPANLRAAVTSEKQEGGVTVREVLLEFGPGHRAKLHLQLLIPPGAGPFPVFLTNHPRARPWIAPAVKRGYIGCIYFAADPIYGAPDDSEAFLEVYPEYDFSALARWAWAGMRAVDYLYTLPKVDRQRIGISGHSRNGKQALIAAAFDERIGAAVPSSGNTGEGNAWRFTTDPFVNESLERITGSFPGWFHPRLRFFAGREHKLPVDQNLLMALVAPRGLLMASAYSEGQGAPFGFEQTFRSVLTVYRFLGAENRIGLWLRAGEHATTAEDIERYVDFFDSVFGRGTAPVPRDVLLPRLPAQKRPAPPAATASARERIEWLLGVAPPVVEFPVRSTLEGRTMTSEGWLGVLFGRPLRIEGVRAVAIPFGDDLKADLYLPDPLPSGRLPAVLWLHPYAYATGYSRDARPMIAALTRRGFAVFTFDQIGFGSRIHEATRFYERYPEWSLLGKMAADTRAAITAVSALEAIDARKVFLAGYSLGGKIALFTAALDSRVAGVVAASAFTPWRTPQAGTEGLAHYTELHALLPRLAFYQGKEREIPIDYPEILEAIAPRPLFLRTPELDRYAHLPHVRAAVEQARAGWKDAPERLRLSAPAGFNRFGADAQREAFDWMAQWR